MLKARVTLICRGARRLGWLVERQGVAHASSVCDDDRLVRPHAARSAANPPWDETAARKSIQRIADSALAAYAPSMDWRTHPLDDPSRRLTVFKTSISVQAGDLGVAGSGAVRGDLSAAELHTLCGHTARSLSAAS